MPEQRAQSRDVAEDGNFAVRLRFGSLHQAADDHGLPIGNNHHGIGGALIDYRGEGAGGNGNPLGLVGQLRSFGLDDHFHHAVGGDERSNAQNNSDTLIGHSIDLTVDRIKSSGRDERDRLAETDGGGLDDHFPHAVGGDERSNAQNNSDTL